MDEGFRFNIFEYEAVDLTQEDLHFHDCLELDFIEAGSGINRIEKRDYDMKQGDVYIINNLEHHMAMSQQELKMSVIVFDPDFVWQGTPENYNYLKPFFQRNMRFSNRISQRDESYEQIRDTIIKLRNEWQYKETGFQLAIKALLMYLLSLLYRHYAEKDELGDDVRKFHDAYERLRPVVEFLHQNYRDEINPENLAVMAAMNKSYFSTYFKQVMGKTLTSYVESLRLQQACLLMRTTNQTLTEIAMSCGFGSTPYFNRSFQKIYGQPPNQYRNTVPADF